jgi:deoxyribodipyrimidine photolyase
VRTIVVLLTRDLRLHDSPALHATVARAYVRRYVREIGTPDSPDPVVPLQGVPRGQLAL